LPIDPRYNLNILKQWQINVGHKVCSHFGATFSIKAQNLKQYISDKLLSTTKPITTFATKHITNLQDHLYFLNYFSKDLGRVSKL
jgi:hypothetical protein